MNLDSNVEIHESVYTDREGRQGAENQSSPQPIGMIPKPKVTRTSSACDICHQRTYRKGTLVPTAPRAVTVVVAVEDSGSGLDTVHYNQGSM